MTSCFLLKALRLSSFLLTAALLLLSPSARPACARTTAAPAALRVGVFSRSLPMLAAQSKGFYARENLTVSYLQVQSSTQQFTFLRDGQYDIINTAADNVVNYRLNDSNPIGARLDVQSFTGTDYGTGCTGNSAGIERGLVPFRLPVALSGRRGGRAGAESSTPRPPRHSS